MRFLADGLVSPLNMNGSQIFLLYLFLFLSGDVIGYLIEVLFRRLFSAKKWVNPGFMRGPWLPLYGFGLMIMFTFCWIMLAYFPLPENASFYNPNGDLFGNNIQSGPTVYDLIPIAIMGISLIALEFLAGLIFVKGFKVKLWDYSNMKGNILGIVCPIFDVIWFVVALLYYYLINPWVYTATISVTQYVLGVQSGYVRIIPLFFFGVIYGVMLVDCIQSIGIFNKIQTVVKQSGVVVNYNRFKEEQKEKLQLSKQKFIESLPEIVQKTIETHSEKKKPINQSALVKKLRTTFLIDPDTKFSYEDHFDENNRPIKEEDSDKNVKKTDKKDGNA